MRVRNSLKCLPITYKYSIVSIAASDTIKMAIHIRMHCTEFIRDFWSFFAQSSSKKLVTAYSDPGILWITLMLFQSYFWYTNLELPSVKENAS